jgi:flagellar FliL protein
MATENEELDGAEGEAGAAEPRSRKGLIIGIVAALVLCGGGAGAYFAFAGGPDAKGSKDKAKVEEKEKLPPRYVALDPPFVVNFEAESAVRFLQVTVGIMTRDPETEKLVKDNDPRVRNDLLMILGGQTYASVATTEGKETLRGKCLEATRAIVREMGGKPDKIEALYFTSFVMQ